jgi:hypothetical protein
MPRCDSTIMLTTLRNVGLLSFGDEGEDAGPLADAAKFKLKSAHDTLKDPRLSSVADDRALDRNYLDRPTPTPPPSSRRDSLPETSTADEKTKELKRVREERAKREQQADRPKSSKAEENEGDR